MDWDLFLSYAHVDDRSPPRWVRDLYSELKDRLETLEPRLAVRTWNDFERLRGDDAIWPSIREALLATRVLVSVVSPGYLDAPYCLLELDTFLRSPRRGEPKVVKLVKLPVDELALPEPLGNMRGFQFHDDSLPQIELDRGQRNRAVHELAWRIAQLVKLARNGPQGCVGVIAGPDRQAALERVTNEILVKEYDVLPGDLPGAVAQRDEVLKHSLDRADLTVLLLGTAYSEDAEAAFDYLTQKLAESPIVRCLVSIPREQPTDSRQQALIARARTTPKGFDRIDEVPASEVWREVQPRLKTIADFGRKPTVYLRYPRPQRNAVDPIRTLIRKNEFDVLDPFESGGFAANVETEAQDRAHGILVYAAERAQDLLLRVVKGLRRTSKKVIGIYPATSNVEIEPHILGELQLPFVLPDPLDPSTPLARSISSLAPSERLTFPVFLDRVRQNAVGQ